MESEIKKLNILIFANCQASSLVIGLSKSKFLNVEYIVNFKWLEEHNTELKNHNEIQFEKSFYNCDIFIYQNIQNSKFQTDFIIENVLKKDCHTVSFSYLYFLGYFPDYFKSKYNQKTISKEYPFGLFPYEMKIFTQIVLNSKFYEIYKNQEKLNQKSILEWSFDTWSKQDQLLWIQIEDKLSKELDFLDFQGILEYSIKTLKEKEQKTDIKLAEFILENYKSFKLFDTVNHPSDILLKVLNDFIIKFLVNEKDINPIYFKEYYFQIQSLDEFQTPIFNKVYQKLNCKFSLPDVWNFHKKQISKRDWLIQNVKFMIQNYDSKYEF